MNRKTTLWILLLLTAILTTGALAGPLIIPVRRVPGDSLAFTGEEAFTKAERLFSEHGYSCSEETHRCKAGSVLLPDGRSAWIVIMERHVEEPVGNLYAVLSGDNGEVIELYYPDNDVSTWALLQWIDAKNKHRNDWPVEEQALFDWLFTGDGDMFEPSQAAVSSEEAVRIASDWMKEHSSTEYDDTGVSYIGLYDDSHTWYCWVISFLRNGNQIMLVHVSTESGEVVNSFDMADGNG